MLAALDGGAEDLADDGEAWRVTTPPTELHKVRTAIEEAGFTVSSADLVLNPTNTVPLDSVDAAKKVLRLIDALDDHDDVQNVYANFDIADDILTSLEGA
jgi:transcriptional/translational regulatory protein YebC/TACO1